jgi:hypothetical protein
MSFGHRLESKSPGFGRGFCLALLLLLMVLLLLLVIPAKAGIQRLCSCAIMPATAGISSVRHRYTRKDLIPAVAGMTAGCVTASVLLHPGLEMQKPALRRADDVLAKPVARSANGMLREYRRTQNKARLAAGLFEQGQHQQQQLDPR